MSEYKNTVLAALLAICISLGAWTFHMNARVTVLEDKIDRYEKVIEKNTEALHRLELVITKLATQLED